jgi:tetratricopeptide (TPR) repeat protein
LKDYNQAIVWLNNTLSQAISGNAASYYGEIADNNERKGAYKNAVLAYQKGLQFREDPAIYTAMADLYGTQLKDKATAAKYYKMAAAAYQKSIPETSNPMNYYILANLLDARLKDTASAIKYYKKFLESKPPKMQQDFINYTQSRINQLQNKTTAASAGQHTSQ